MKSKSWSTAALAVIASTAIGVSAIELSKREGRTAPAVVGTTIQRRDVADPVARDRRRRTKMKKRDGTVQATLDNLETLYFANLTVGTPPQRLRLHIDTGSSDLWTNAASSSLCQRLSKPCERSGTYDANSSSTYNFVNDLFDISYVDGSAARGDYVTDNLGIGDVILEGLQFGVGYDSSSEEGVMGIGYALNEVQVNRAGLDPYPNIPELMVRTGLTNSISYSLWLNDLDANTGSILFGGVDTEKYVGSLSTLPIISEQRAFTEFIVSLTGLGQGGEVGSIVNGMNVPVLLDSGSSLTYLPNNLVRTIYTIVGADYDSSQQAAIVDCDLANEDMTIDFTFTEPTISVPMNELVIEAGVTRRGNPICIFGINPADDSTPVLGDTFLRSAYVVYHLTNNEISIAPTNFNATETNILEVGSGRNGVPDASGVPDAPSTGTVSGSGNPRRTGRPKVNGAAAGGGSLAQSAVTTCLVGFFVSFGIGFLLLV